MSAIAGGAAIGAGVGISSVALMPFNSANTFLGSAFFGYGMILGERYMYQADWPKIQARLEHGEKIENIIQEYTGVFTAVVMKEAKIIFDSVSSEMAKIIADTLGLGGAPPGTAPPPPQITTPPVPPPIIGGISQPPVSAPQVIIKPENERENKIYMVQPRRYCFGRIIKAGVGKFALQANHDRNARDGKWTVLRGSTSDKQGLINMAWLVWPKHNKYFTFNRFNVDWWALDLS